MKRLLENKNILFITTKNMDYIRNSQEINLIKKYSSDYTIIGSYNKNYLKRMVYVFFRLLITKFKGVDIIFVGFAPQLIIPFWKRKFRNKKVIIDFFISMYDTFVFDRKKIRENSFIAKIIKGIDKYTLISADEVITDTKAHGEYFIDEFGLNRSRLRVLYLEADKEIYSPRDIKRPKYLIDKFVVLYFGSILPLQGIDTVLKAADLLKDENRIHFIIIGPIEKKYSKVISNTITYIDWVPQQELADYISFSDLCLAGHFNKDINKAKRTIPGKAYIYQAMGKRMILGDNLATHELFTEGDNATFVEMGNATALSKRILEIAQSK